MRRKLIAGVVVLLLALSIYYYALTPVGKPPGTCPEFRWALAGYPGTNQPAFSIVAVGEGGQYQTSLGNSPISWCIYGGSGQLERSYRTNTIFGNAVASADESRLVVSGSQPWGSSPEVVYLFDSDGTRLWSTPLSQQANSLHINGNGSVIVGNDPGLLYIDGSGRVLWTFAEQGRDIFTAALVNEGADVVAGVDNIFIPNHSSYGSELILLDAHGRALWNVTIPDQQFGSSANVAASGGFVAAGVANSGWNGTLYYYGLQGNLVWSRHVSNDILWTSFEDGGSAVMIQTNCCQVKYDLSGKLVANQTVIP